MPNAPARRGGPRTKKFRMSRAEEDQRKSTKFIIIYDAGHGTVYEVINAENIGEAKKKAHDTWRYEVERHADYNAIEYSKEWAKKLGV